MDTTSKMKTTSDCVWETTSVKKKKIHRKNNLGLQTHIELIWVNNINENDLKYWFQQSL